MIYAFDVKALSPNGIAMHSSPLSGVARISALAIFRYILLQVAMLNLAQYIAEMSVAEPYAYLIWQLIIFTRH